MKYRRRIYFQIVWHIPTHVARARNLLIAVFVPYNILINNNTSNISLNRELFFEPRTLVNL